MSSPNSGDQSEGEDHCPLCMEELDLIDKNFIPCPCGYRVCMWCWHHIKENLNGLCPACRKPYEDNPHEFAAVDRQEVVRKTRERKLKEKQERKTVERPSKQIVDKRQLHNYRVVQRNLVYVIGVPASIASEELLRQPEYFGQYGKISKIVIHRNHSAPHQTVSAYVTFAYREDARVAIQALDNAWVDGHHLRASFGTTKYCNNFIRGTPCNNPECVYLHELGDEDDRFTKEEIQAGYSKLTAPPNRDAPNAVVGNGGPSGTGKRCSEPVFPPPVFERPAPQRLVRDNSATEAKPSKADTPSPEYQSQQASAASSSTSFSAAAAAIAAGAAGNAGAAASKQDGNGNYYSNDAYFSPAASGDSGSIPASPEMQPLPPPAIRQAPETPQQQPQQLESPVKASTPQPKWMESPLVGSSQPQYSDESKLIGRPPPHPQSGARQIQQDPRKARKLVGSPNKEKRYVPVSTPSPGAPSPDFSQQSPSSLSMSSPTGSQSLYGGEMPAMALPPQAVDHRGGGGGGGMGADYGSAHSVSSSFNGFGRCAVFPVPVSSLAVSVWATLLQVSTRSPEGDLMTNPFSVVSVSVSELLELTLPPVDAAGMRPWPKPLSYYSQSGFDQQQQQAQQHYGEPATSRASYASMTQGLASVPSTSHAPVQPQPVKPGVSTMAGARGYMQPTVSQFPPTSTQHTQPNLQMLQQIFPGVNMAYGTPGSTAASVPSSQPDGSNSYMPQGYNSWQHYQSQGVAALHSSR